MTFSGDLQKKLPGIYEKTGVVAVYKRTGVDDINLYVQDDIEIEELPSGLNAQIEHQIYGFQLLNQFVFAAKRGDKIQTTYGEFTVDAVPQRDNFETTVVAKETGSGNPDLEDGFEVSSIVADGKSIDFVVADWTGPVSGKYELELTHGLNTNDTIVAIREGTDNVEVEYINTTADKIKLFVFAEPDDRFAGTANIERP